jgi:hypothetical protein
MLQTPFFCFVLGERADVSSVTKVTATGWMAGAGFLSGAEIRPLAASLYRQVLRCTHLPVESVPGSPTFLS